MKYENITKYLPYFAEEGDAGEWQGRRQPDGQVTMPYVSYQKEIGAFLREFSACELIDREYGEKMDARGWWDESAMAGAIGEMSASDVGTCITAIVRRERFSEGTILRFIKNGILAKLLARLKELDEEK